jgi:hypothetical protein
MKKICNFVFVIVFIIGCNETPPIIDFSEKNSDLLDTTYIVSPIPSSVSTMIFVEDLTGVRCSNCPKAAEKIKEIKVANPGNVVAIGAYPGTLKNFMDPWPGFSNSKYNRSR